MKADTLKNIIILILLAAVAYLFFNKAEEKQEEIITENDLNGTITPEKARELQAKFINTRAKMFSDSLGYEDSRSFTMSVAKMDSFTAYIKQAYPKLPNLGLRFYLGAKREGSLKEGLSTMFIVPTSTPNTVQKGGLFSAAAPPPPAENIPDGAVQDEMNNDNPPHNY